MKIPKNEACYNYIISALFSKDMESTCSTSTAEDSSDTELFKRLFKPGQQFTCLNFVKIFQEQPTWKAIELHSKLIELSADLNMDDQDKQDLNFLMPSILANQISRNELSLNKPKKSGEIDHHQKLLEQMQMRQDLNNELGEQKRSMNVNLLKMKELSEEQNQLINRLKAQIEKKERKNAKLNKLYQYIAALAILWTFLTAYQIYSSYN